MNGVEVRNVWCVAHLVSGRDVMSGPPSSVQIDGTLFTWELPLGDLGHSLIISSTLYLGTLEVEKSVDPPIATRPGDNITMVHRVSVTDLTP